ncbi:hypothetical protein ACRQ5D_22510 [Mucilaginibacter sp. P25]|uniref:Transposase n=1 Tax=Mucilaginibacter gossypii TaxID=551996 RepID=A0A1G8D895_9SPHI|nr:hypothetical protein [Mucilaginibacter gossypii]SDH53956.1 hypothetical protein SAMN05192573_110153 [Mucilaginibacter gossypii]
MEQKSAITCTETIDKKNSENEDFSNNFRKLLAEIVLEIIIKRRKNGRHWVYKNK